VWLLKQKPVWSIVIYTDDALWRKSITDQFYYGFSSAQQKQYFHFDVIKVNREKSSDLINKHSLLCKLLALKANDEGIAPESLVAAIYQAVAQMKDQLTADQLLLVNQWVDYYKKVPEPVLTKIKQEVNMELVETTISEHVYNQGKAEGLAEDKAEGKAEGLSEGLAKGLAKGLLEGQLVLLDNLHQLGILADAQRHAMATPLQQKLKDLMK